MEMRSALALVCLIVCGLAVSAVAGEIHVAAAEGDLARVRALLESDPGQRDALDEGNMTPLHHAATAGMTEVVRFLLDSGSPVDIGDNENSTPLDVASVNGHLETVRLLVERGANVSHQDVNLMTPVFFAMYNGQDETAAYLIEQGADVNAVRPDGSSLLHAAAYSNNIDVARVLLEAGADVHARNGALFTPVLSCAAGAGTKEMVEFLVENGADVHDRQIDGESALMYASARGDTQLMRYLLEQGASVGANSDIAGLAAIGYAAMEGSTEAIDLLLAHGADIEDASDGGWTPLPWAASRGHGDAVRHLLDLGAEPDAAAADGITSLMQACRGGDGEMARALLDHGASVNVRDENNKRTALHDLALGGNTELAGMMLDAGARIDARDGHDMTPLHYAVKYGYKETAEMLKARGAVAEDLEENYGEHPLLRRRPAEGEASLWYLGHGGYGIKTRNHFLIFDYWSNGEDPASAGLANGRIVPDEIANENVCVFVTHEHGDHYDPAIFEWADRVDDIRYVYGLRPEPLPQHREEGYNGPEYQYMAPHELADIDGIIVRTIAANDGGVGFLVEVDGLVIYHAGDHAGWNEGGRDEFTAEIDYLDEHVDELDIALLNVTGCHAHGPEQLREGNAYTIETLKPKVMIPTHASSGREHVYREAAEEPAYNTLTQVAYPENRGDSFIYSGGTMTRM
jgi:ankyrin repeat protein